ncbi:MAG: hypothetical protein ACRBI6_16955 [Acidimicrobiales bacterium]
MRIVDVVLPVVGGERPTTIRFAPDLTIVDADRITLAQLRTVFGHLLAGRLDARWTVAVDDEQGPATRALAERLGAATGDGVVTLAAEPSGDPLDHLAVRAGAELLDLALPLLRTDEVTAGLRQVDDRERLRLAEHEQRLVEAEHRRDLRAADVEIARTTGLAAAVEGALERLRSAQAALETARASEVGSDPRLVATAFILSLHHSTGGRRARLRPADLDRLDRTLAVLAAGRNPLAALADAELGPVGDRLAGHLIAAGTTRPDIGSVPLVIDSPLPGADPLVVRQALAPARALAAGTQLIVLGASPALTDWLDD